MPRLALLPEYLVFGKDGFALALAWSVYVLVLLALSAWTAGPTARRVPALLLGAIAAAYLSGRREMFASPWNPWMATIAVVCFSITALTVVRGHHRAIPFLLISATFACQAHIAAAAPVAIGVTATAFASWPVIRTAPRKILRRSLIICLVMWAPTMIDALVHRGGNIGAIIKYVRADSVAPDIGWIKAIGVIGRWTAMNSPVFGFDRPIRTVDNSVSVDSMGSVFPGAMLILAASLCLILRRRRIGREILLIALMILATIPTISSNQGTLYEYTFGWLVPLIGILLVLLVSALFKADTTRSLTPSLATRMANWAPRNRDQSAMAVVAIGTIAIAFAGMPNADSRGTLSAAATAGEGRLPKELTLRPPLDGSAFGLEAGLVRVLERQGHDVELTSDWSSFLGFGSQTDEHAASYTAFAGCSGDMAAVATWSVVPFSEDQLDDVVEREQAIAAAGLGAFERMDQVRQLAEQFGGRTCLALAP